MFIVPLSRMAPLESITKTGQFGSIGASSAIGGTGNQLGNSFADIFNDAYKNVTETKKVSDLDSYNLAMGNSDDIASIMINSLKTSTALETATQLTSRAVSSYKEIMQMQV